MIVLGFNGFSQSASFFDAYFNSRGRDQNLLIGHDAGAAIFKDGILIAAAEEERFSRIKKTSNFPKHAINFCLKEAGIALADVDKIATPWDFNEQWITNKFSKIFQNKSNFSQKLALFEKMKTYYMQVVSHQTMIRDFNLNMSTNFKQEQFVFVPHHITHMMAGFLLSGMQESAFLVTDGQGEDYSSVMGHISKEKFEIFDHVDINNSIGILYRKFTRYLGFTPNCDEYKVMAMGAFVDQAPDYDMNHFIELLPKGKFRIKLPTQRGHTAYYHFFEQYFGSQKDEDTFNKIAYFIQDITEKVIWHQISYLQEKVNSDLLLLDGGVALNCVNNSKILAKSKFKDVHVSFAASDSGVAIGAGFYPFYEAKQFVQSEITPYLGPAYTAKDARIALESKADQITFKELNDETLFDEIVEHLANKKIIGWFQGKMEFGPRALGNRSILANPAFADMKEIINAKVKYREAFRPFAGVMIESKASKYFAMGKKQTSPFMTFVFDTKSEAQQHLSGAVHVDGTSRLQTVTETQNPKLYHLLETFSAKTGTDCLINTSFNIQGEPIVCEPIDAVKCFLNSGIDILVIENFIVSKK
jgi:carbamoyltransferase